MPEFGELQPTEVWAATTRTLTDISEEEICDLPLLESRYRLGTIASAASADGFGSWTQLIADVGTGKRLIYLGMRPDSLTVDAWFEVEIGEGASGSEAAVARMNGICYGSSAMLTKRLNKSLSNNARITARVRDHSASALTWALALETV